MVMESLGAEEADVRSADGEEIKAQEAESCEGKRGGGVGGVGSHTDAARPIGNFQFNNQWL